jgi:hypothetical protein
MTWTSRWVCDDCYKNWRSKLGELPIMTIYNSFKAPCADCGKLAEHYVNLPILEEAE